MKTKTRAPAIVALLAAVVVVVTFTYISASEGEPVDSGKGETTAPVGDSVSSKDTTAPEIAPDSGLKVVAYYFHGTRRCYTCRRIEAYSAEAIEEGFKEKLADGELEFHSVNTDEEPNRHYVKDYRLYTKSLVVSRLENGKEMEWKNLAKIWELHRNKEKFLQYVQDEVKAYLAEN